MSKRMRLINVILVSVLMPFSGMAYATVDTGGGDFPTVPAPKTPTTMPTAPPVATPAPTGGPTFPMATGTPAAGPSINPAAAQGQASQNGGAGANNAAGAALIAAGAAMMANPPTVPIGAMLMAMGMLALAQGSHDNNAANQSGATYAASVNANPALGTGTAAYTSPDVAKAQAALADAGYNMTPNGLKTPDGSTIPNSAFNSPDAMAKAGIDPNHIAAIQKALADVNGNAPKVSSMAMSEGSGGYSAKGSSSGGSSIHFANPFNLNSAQKGQMIAGKTVLFDGDPIGVRGQNIFDMVHERYEKRRQTNDFIENDTGADVRAPASVKPTVLKTKPK